MMDNEQDSAHNMASQDNNENVASSQSHRTSGSTSQSDSTGPHDTPVEILDGSHDINIPSPLREETSTEAAPIIGPSTPSSLFVEIFGRQVLAADAAEAENLSFLAAAAMEAREAGDSGLYADITKA